MILLLLLICLNFAVGIDRSTLGNVRVLKIIKIENLGKSQDNNECAKNNDKQDEINFSFESAGQEIDVLKESVFDIDQVRYINREFLCVDTAILRMREVDLLKKDLGKMKIGCYKGDYAKTAAVDIPIDALGCYFEMRTVKYRIHYTIREFETKSMVKVNYIYNINAPFEKTIDLDIDPFSGDEYMLVAQYDNIDITFDVPYDQTGSFIKSKRNSITKFKDLVIPCTGLNLHITEKDAISWQNQVSNTIRFDCDENGYQDHIFQIGDMQTKGKYRMLAIVDDQLEKSFK